MDFKKLKKRLAAEAKAKGICREWYEFILNAPDKQRLLTLFVKGCDFCLLNDFPSPELRAEFNDTRREYGIFINDRVAVKSLRNIFTFGTTTGRAEYANFDVGQIYARQDTEITITATENAYVVVDVADRAKVNIEASGKAHVSIFLHGGSYTANESGAAQIKLIDKR